MQAQLEKKRLWILFDLSGAARKQATGAYLTF
jgi:hypothetical protein